MQLTWKANHAKAGNLRGCDLMSQPDLAMRSDVATKVMFDGILTGLFTGKKLADYVAGTACDYVSARRIINGTDRASLIAGYARSFEAALRASARQSAPAAAAPAKPKAAPPVATSPKAAPALVARILSAFRRAA